ncbi:hypothetical protein [Rhodocytophaga aerolata]|uniref:hypothetical protein n=1 Tax=Rhodocytophaga aerolata TaxID=455078 RepID=UPI00366D414D
MLNSKLDARATPEITWLQINLQTDKPRRGVANSYVIKPVPSLVNLYKDGRYAAS